MRNNFYEVGTIIENEWDAVLLENATYDEAWQHIRAYEGSETLCLYDTKNNISEYYKEGKQIQCDFGIALE